MANIAEIRQQYPQYSDMSDTEFADAMHSKFYADIPKQDFYVKMGIKSNVDQIPGMPPQQQPQQDRGFTNPVMRALSDVGSAVIETPATLATGALGGLIGNIAGVGASLLSPERGTPEGAKIGQQTAQKIAEMLTYQPRGQGAKDVLETTAPVLQNLSAIPIPTLQAAGTTVKPMAQALRTYGGAGIEQVRTTPSALITALKTQPPAMAGGGAALTEQAALRQERAAQLGLQLSKGEQLQDLATQQFESEIALQKPETTGKPLVQFKEKQQQDIVNKFLKMSEETGAQFADYDPAAYRKIGSIVDKVLVTEYDKRLQKVNANYQKARDAGETKQVVDTNKLDEWLTNNEPEAISVPQINSIKSKLETLKKATNGQVTIDDLENLYQVAGQLGKPGDPSGVFMRQVKKVINDMTEGAGGDLYREARLSRAQLGTDFENNYRVAKLLGTKAGYADRAVALSDVFDHVVLDGSLEEMQSVTRLLKKAGPEGEQVFKELQGQTIQYIRGQLTKSPNQLSFTKVKNVIDSLERENKLSYLFGKQGSQEILNLKDYLQDALVKKPGAVNYAQSGNLLARTLDKIESLNVIGLKQVAGIAKNMAEAKKVKESINYNALDQQ